MKVFIMRHGEAVDGMIDPERPLSEEGKIEVKKVADFLVEKVVKVEKVFHSEKLRSEQTARIVWEKIGGELELRKGLNPGDNEELFQEFLEESAMSGSGDLMMVGHLPFVDYLVEKMGGGFVQFLTATCVCLESQEEGSWRVDFVIGPNDL